MLSGMRDHVAGCQMCQQQKILPGSAPRELIPIPPPDHAFETIGIYYIAVLPKTRKGNSYVLVAVDYLSKYVDGQHVPTPSSQHVVDFIEGKIQ